MTGPKNHAPSVSVVIPVFNAANVVQDAVESVVKQTMPDWELFLVDDGTTDGSNQSAKLKEIATSDPRIHVLQTIGRQGAGPARNMGMAAAKGRYIAFLDADDMWHPQKLALQLAAMENAGAVLSCTAITRVNVATGARIDVGVPARVARKQLLRTNVIACSSAVYDSDHYGLRQMPTLRRRQDFAFWLSLMEDGSRAIGVPQSLVIYRQMPTSLSAPKHKAARDTWIMYRHHLGLPVWQAGYYFAHYALRGATRHFAPKLAGRIGWMHPVAPLSP